MGKKIIVVPLFYLEDGMSLVALENILVHVRARAASEGFNRVYLDVDCGRDQCKLTGERYETAAEEAARLQAQAKIEGQERAEYERLRAKFGS